MIYDCIIIGAGPAGLMAGCFLDGKKVVVLEGESKPAQKLLLSGGGQCNLTHTGEIKNFFDKFGERGRFVRKALTAFDNQRVMEFFKTRQIELVQREDGKVFPRSLDAWDILRCLRKSLSEMDIELKTDAKVQTVTYENGHFLVNTSGKIYKGRSVLLATGGSSYPMTGSDGSGVHIAEILGHAIVPARPALTPVYIEKFPLRALAGISYVNGQVSHWQKGKKIGTYVGDVLVTHTGLSGPGILDNSRYMNAGDELKLRLVDENKTVQMLEEALLSGRKKMVKTIVSEFMSKRVAEFLVEYTCIKNDVICAEFGKKDRKKLLECAEALPLKIQQMGNLKSAMTTSGGVSTKEIAAGTMASKLIPGLYVAGEVMDVDGNSGGYNIQWAFSSGRLAAKSIGAYLTTV